MLKRPLVVVPVDSSRGAETSVAYALALAQRRGADVDLLHVVRPRGPSVFEAPDLGLVGQTLSPRHRMEHVPGEPRPEALALAFAAAPDDVHVRQMTRKGEPGKAIGAYAQLAMAAVIVIGKYYGSSRWRSSTAVVSRLSRSTPVPLLIVPPQDTAGAALRTGPFVNIVSAVDFTVSSAVALRTALDLAQTSGGRVTMVHALKNAPGRLVLSGSEASAAIDEVHAEIANVAARLRRTIPDAAAGRVDSRVTTGDPHRGILEVASQVQADLIVMGVPPRGRVDEVLFGSTLRGVLRRASSPVLVLPVAAGAHEWVVGATP